MSGYGIHQPLLSRYLVVEVPGGNGATEARHVGRCFCGWESEWLDTAWKAGRATREHVEATRRRP